MSKKKKPLDPLKHPGVAKRMKNLLQYNTSSIVPINIPKEASRLVTEAMITDPLKATWGPRLFEIMFDLANDKEDKTNSLRAATYLVDRFFGKSTQEIKAEINHTFGVIMINPVQSVMDAIDVTNELDITSTISVTEVDEDVKTKQTK